MRTCIAHHFPRFYKISNHSNINPTPFQANLTFCCVVDNELLRAEFDPEFNPELTGVTGVAGVTDGTTAAPAPAPADPGSPNPNGFSIVPLPNIGGKPGVNPIWGMDEEERPENGDKKGYCWEAAAAAARAKGLSVE